MRRVVFVFLLCICTIISTIGVYAEGVGGVGMTVKLPPPPDGVDNFVIGYMPKLGTYRLGSTNYDGDIFIADNETLVDDNGNPIYFGARYELVGGTWVQYTSSAYWTEWCDDISSVESQEGKVVVFSSNNFYGTKGQLLANAASDDVKKNGLTIFGNLSTSKILLYMFAPFRQVLPYIIVFIVVAIAFYKGWRWLSGQAQGV